jgi:transposase
LQQPGTRWQLSTIQAACDWLKERTVSCVSRTLKRLGIHFKHSRDHVHSPDVNYVEKLADIVAALEAAVASDGRLIVVFLDEFSFYRQPTGARNWCVIGAKHQPLAERSHHSDTCGRIVGGLNGLTGQTLTKMASKITVPQLVAFYKELRQAYPEAETIYVVQDNWPVHFHPDVVAALQPQQTRWEFKTPPSWPKEPSDKAKKLALPIQFLPLPTYASWCNPIEKFWRKLQQELLHLHRDAEDWPTLKEKIKEWLARFREGSKDLLRYVGLTENSKLYGALFRAPQTNSG